MQILLPIFRDFLLLMEFYVARFVNDGGVILVVMKMWKDYFE